MNMVLKLLSSSLDVRGRPACRTQKEKVDLKKSPRRRVWGENPEVKRKFWPRTQRQNWGVKSKV